MISPAMLDDLTNLANRGRFMAFMADAWQQADRMASPIAVILVDVDHFQGFNDASGPAEGDRCLQQIAGFLRERIRRTTDLAARYGGDEFVVLLTDTEATGAGAVAEAIRAGVEQFRIPHPGSSAGAHVTVSVGVAVIVPRRDSAADGLMAAAERAMTAAKAGGRNRCAIAQPA
jgi:diguanylate cyclase (GGDEF)-like protein